MNRAAYLRELRRLREHLDSIVEQAFVASDFGEAVAGAPGSWTPAVDLFETPEAYVLLAEVPGVERGDLNLEVEGRRLTLSGRRRPPARGGTFHRMERHHGPFRRAFVLDHEVEAGDVEADLSEGMLTVKVFKAERRRHRVEVTDGEETHE